MTKSVALVTKMQARNRQLTLPNRNGNRQLINIAGVKKYSSSKRIPRLSDSPAYFIRTIMKPEAMTTKQWTSTAYNDSMSTAVPADTPVELVGISTRFKLPNQGNCYSFLVTRSFLSATITAFNIKFLTWLPSCLLFSLISSTFLAFFVVCITVGDKGGLLKVH